MFSIPIKEGGFATSLNNSTLSNSLSLIPPGLKIVYDKPDLIISFSPCLCQKTWSEYRELITKVAMHNYTTPSDITGLSEGMESWKDNKIYSEKWNQFDINMSLKILDSLQYSFSNSSLLYNNKDINCIKFFINKSTLPDFCT